MMWWWDGPHWMMVLWPIGLMLVCAVGMMWFMRADGMAMPRRHEPLDILKERFARGEIDRTEYEDRRRVLSQP